MANEDLLLRQMPHSLEGEQAVLGSMLIDEGCVKDVMDKLVPSDFYLRQNREIFETIYTMFTYARPIDGITVCEEMQKAGPYDENTTRSYLAQLMEITPTAANVKEYVAIVKDEKDGVLTGGETKLGLVSDDIIPNKVCLIPDLLKTLPYKPFACSAIDALVHATESFLSPHRKTMTSELFSEKAMDMILKGFKLIDEKGKDARFEYLDEFVTASFYALSLIHI